MLRSPIIFFKKLRDIGGPTSFQKKFIFWLKKNKVEYGFLDITNLFKKKFLFINAGTFNFPLLFLSILFRTKLVQRLDGFYNFSNETKYKKKIRGLFINFSMQFIRKYLANHIIYQSLNSKKQWDQKFKKVKTNFSIIHNPTFDNIDKSKIKKKSIDMFDIIIVEGNIEDNYYNNKLLNLIYEASMKNKKIRKIFIFGNVESSLKKKLLEINKFTIKGSVSHNKLFKFYKRNNLIFFGIEFNACCSNSIIETTPYGIPSITLNTGSYKELIKNSGIQINFRNINDFNLEYKISKSLSKIINNYKKYSILSLKNSYNFKPKNIFNKYIKSIKSIQLSNK